MLRAPNNPLTDAPMGRRPPSATAPTTSPRAAGHPKRAPSPPGHGPHPLAPAARPPPSHLPPVSPPTRLPLTWHPHSTAVPTAAVRRPSTSVTRLSSWPPPPVHRRHRFVAPP